MKVAHIVRRFTRAEWGGTETVVENLVAGERRSLVDARVFATAALHDPSADARAIADCPVTRHPYRYPYFPLSRDARRALDKKGGNPCSPELLAAVRAFEPDLVHIHAGGRLALGAIRLARQMGVPSVMSLHGGAAAVPPQELAELLRPLRGTIPYGGLLDRLTGLHGDPVDRTDAIVCISREEESRLRARHGARVVYIPNGIPAARLEPPRPRREKRTRLLCVSRIDYQKNQKILVRALAELPDLQVTLIGPVTAEWYGRELGELATALGVRDRLTVVPGLPPDSPELRAAFRDADLFVLPSVHEPFGIVALEAWASRLPLVATSVGGLKDFVVDGKNGLLVPPNDLFALVSAIERIRHESDLADRLVLSGAEDVRSYFWESVVSRHLDLYRRLIG